MKSGPSSDVDTSVLLTQEQENLVTYERQVGRDYQDSSALRLPLARALVRQSESTQSSEGLTALEFDL
jgi:hypothetical protein